MKSRNLKLAKEAMTYTLRMIKHSTNHMSEEEKDSDEGKAILAKMDTMRSQKINYPEYSLGWIMEVSRLAIEYGVGNCVEKSCVAFCFILNNIADMPEEDQPQSLNLVNNPFQDHFFVAVGKLTQSEEEFNNPLKWCKKAAISDCWAEQAYSLSDLANSTVFAGIGNIRKGKLQTNLTEEVLANANEIHHPSMIIIKQPRIVLRHRLTHFSHLNLMAPGMNLTVPMVYERWDYPTKHDRKKQAARDVVRSELSAFSVFNKTQTSQREEPIDLVMSYLFRCK